MDMAFAVLPFFLFRRIPPSHQSFKINYFLIAFMDYEKNEIFYMFMLYSLNNSNLTIHSVNCHHKGIRHGFFFFLEQTLQNIAMFNSNM